MWLDVIASKPLRSVALWPGFPVVLQLVAVAVTGLLIAVGIGVGTGMTSADLMVLRKTNLTTLVVFGLWWPATIVATVALGHLWCVVCPMELLNRTGERLGSWLGLRRLPLGKVLRAGWMIVALYLLLLVLITGISLQRCPHHTAVFLLVLSATALASGIVFREPRAFCRTLCPAAALLSVYGRFTPAQLEVRVPSVCAQCRTKDCVRAAFRDRLDRRSCPSLLRPFRREASDGCVLCLQCAKVCPHDNIGVGLVSDAAPVRRMGLLRPHEAAFVMIALGFVAHEVSSEVKWLDRVFRIVPEALARVLPAVPVPWFEALWFLVLFPTGIWVLIAAVAWAAGLRSGLRSILLAGATGAAPMVAMAHSAKAVAKLASWGGYVPLALGDPAGIRTFRGIVAKTLPAPSSLVGSAVLGWVMLVVMLLLAGKAWRWARQLAAGDRAPAKAGLAISALLFSVMLTMWGWPVR